MSVSYNEILQNNNAELEGILNAVNELPSGGGTSSVSIPPYWQAHIDEKVAEVKALQDDGGKDCFSFVLMTDTHYPSNLGHKAPILAKHILDKCDIKFALHLGDAQTRGCWNTKELLLAENKQIEEMLSPIRDRLLQTEGNHDGAYGWLDRDGDGKYDNTDKEPAERETYVYNLTPAELHSAIYRKVGLVGDIHFDESGSGYYVDDVPNKVRYIVLNTQCNKYELQADGTAKYPKMWLMNFTQPQFDLVIDALSNIPSDSWGVVVAGHCPLFQEIADREIMQGVLNAYKSKTAYAGKYDGKADSEALYNNLAKNFETGRLNSSGAVSTSNAEGAVTCTDYIPLSQTEETVIRIKGYGALTDYNVTLYTDQKVASNSSSATTIFGSRYSYDTETGVVTLINYPINEFVYLRVSGIPTGTTSDIVITVNEEIIAGGNSKNLAEPLPNNTTDTTKWVNGYRFSSTGISAQSSGVPSTLSNEIPITFGDVIRIKGVTLREGSDRWQFTLKRVDTGEVSPNYQYFNNNMTAGIDTYLTYEGVENGVYTYRVTSDTNGHTPVSFRIAFPTPTNANDVIITVNEFEGSSGSPYDAVSVNCDFSNAKGDLVGYFHGHTHLDSVNNSQSFKIIGTRCDAKEENTEELRNERVAGTTTEQSFDVFTVNKKTRKIYATKIGAGNNREIGY